MRRPASRSAGRLNKNPSPKAPRRAATGVEGIDRVEAAEAATLTEALQGNDAGEPEPGDPVAPETGRERAQAMGGGARRSRVSGAEASNVVGIGPHRPRRTLMGAKPRLTDRQAAVLASVERCGSATGLDLWRAFRPLNQSTLVRVLDRLVELGFLVAEGDPALRYCGGVRYAPAGDVEPLDPLIEGLGRFASETLGLRTWRLGAAVRIALPLSEIERDLSGGFYSAFSLIAGYSKAGSLDHLRARLSTLVKQGLVKAEVLSGVLGGPEAALVVAVELASG